MLDFEQMSASAVVIASSGFERAKSTAGNLIQGAPQDGDILIASGFILPVVLLIWLIFRVRRASAGVRAVTRRARLLGSFTSLFFFAVLGVWAYHAPISSAALATGVVSPDGSRKTVQHLEGGIIRSILVREGDRVSAGTPLLTLENLSALARFQELSDSLYFLVAAEARLMAESSDAASIVFPRTLLEAKTARAGQAMQGQQQLFDDRRETQGARERILASRMQQLREEITGQEGVIDAEIAQADLLRTELEAAEKLQEQGLMRLGQVLDLKRHLIRVQSDIAAGRAQVARLNQQIGETELQLIATHQQTREAVSGELAEIRAQIAKARAQLPERQDALARTVVTAPIDGRVMNVKVTTEQGGVLNAGGAILDIVPEESALVIDARVRPGDIEAVHPGLRAQVMLTAYSQRNLPQLYGELQSVSADRLVDERTGEPYFLAKVHVKPEDVEALGDEIALMSGMSADVMILTGEQTMFDFLFQPFVDSITRSFRES